jgi:hypothetical protein
MAADWGILILLLTQQFGISGAATAAPTARNGVRATAGRGFRGASIRF